MAAFTGVAKNGDEWLTVGTDGTLSTFTCDGVLVSTSRWSSEPLRCIDSRGGDLAIGGDDRLLIKPRGERAFGRPMVGSHLPVWGVSFEKAGQRLVSCSSGWNTAEIWDMDSVKQVATFEGGWDLMCCDWHPSKPLVLIGGKDNTVRLWDLRSSAAPTKVEGHRNTVTTVRWNPFNDGATFCSGGRDHTFRVWDTANLRLDAMCRDEAGGEVRCSAWCGADLVAYGTRCNGVGFLQFEQPPAVPWPADTEVNAMAYDAETLVAVGAGEHMVAHRIP